MKKYNKSVLTTVLLILALIIIIVMGFFTYKFYTEKTKAAEKSTQLQSQVDSLNETINDLQEKIDKVSETVNPSNTTNATNSISDKTTSSAEKNSSSNNNNNQSSNISKKSNSDLIKEYLKNSECVENNLKLKTSCFNTDITGNQTLKFIQINTGENCSVVVKSVAESDSSVGVFLVSCQNGQVIVNSLTDEPLHFGHNEILVSPNDKKILIDYMHMDAVSKSYYSIEDGNFKLIDEVGYEIKSSTGEAVYYKNNYNQKCSKDEYDTINDNYKSINFKTVDTELTNSNIDNYVK